MPKIQREGERDKNKIQCLKTIATNLPTTENGIVLRHDRQLFD